MRPEPPPIADLPEGFPRAGALTEPAMSDAVSPYVAPRKVWSPFGIAWMTLLLSVLAGGVLHALNERRLGRKLSWRVTLYRNLLVGTMLLLPGLLGAQRPGSLLAGNIFVALYFYKSQADPFAQHVAAGGVKARFSIPVLVTLGAAVLFTALVGL
jgi:hypothetical protein